MHAVSAGQNVNNMAASLGTAMAAAISCGGPEKMSRGILIAIILSLFIYLSVRSEKTNSDELSEKLLIKPLETGHVYAFFQFTTTWNGAVAEDANAAWETNFRLFPRSIGEIASRHQVHELHLRLTQGLWKHSWGFPVISTSPGAELWVWFRNDTRISARNRWKELTNALSGQFCASLNFIDASNTAQPRLSFRPEGVIPADSNGPDPSLLFYATLPQESVCTENLTPWKKLLPCDTKAGLSTLLNAIRVFNSNYFSLSVDLMPICQDPSCTSLAMKLQQTVSVVFNPVNSHPHGKQDWSFIGMFGAVLKSSCPVASVSKVYVDISSNESNPFSLLLTPTEILSKDATGGFGRFAVYDVRDVLQREAFINVAASYAKKHVYWVVPPLPLHATRYVKGYGLGSGGINCRITNHEAKPLKVIYLEIIPWFLRMYLHTLRITHKGAPIKPEYQYYQPGKDREQPYHLELVLTLPPSSTIEISFEFDRAFLKWTEYPPDANHGFYVGPAVISAILPTNRNATTLDFPSDAGQYFVRVHTETLLVSLPTPDFSMPYNVICLVCTVIALAFGPIHNVTTKKLHIVVKESGGLMGQLKRLIWKGKKTEEKDKKDK